VFTVRYGLIPNITQIPFALKGLKIVEILEVLICSGFLLC
jgi:hypothetical protein